jgi:DNA invertase Pin-like site-specific DNA recombinase
MIMTVPANKPVTRKLRCAVYTRKSSEEGLDMEFNSLDAQREACEAYVASQRPEGWILVPDRYDDGGISGATLAGAEAAAARCRSRAGRCGGGLQDRPAVALANGFFQAGGRIRRHPNVTFVSVTQSFSTTTSMGRLTLNILLSFAQFEREVIGERIRDKFAPSRRKGMWMGGYVPLGYRLENRKLLLDEKEAETVRIIFQRFLTIGSATTLAMALHAGGITMRNGRRIDKGYLYKLLNNRIYVGDAVHKGTAASIRRSSPRTSGTRCTASLLKVRGSERLRAAGRRQRCSRG